MVVCFGFVQQGLDDLNRLFCKSISLWVVGTGGHVLDTPFFGEALYSSAVYWGPLSLLMTIGIPCRASTDVVWVTMDLQLVFSSLQSSMYREK